MDNISNKIGEEIETEEIETVEKIIRKQLIYNLDSQEEKVITKLFELKNRLLASESRESNTECDLWVKTDFKNMKLTNSEQRKAYVKQQMATYVRTSGLYKNEINLCENVLKLIRSKRRFLLETDYTVEVNNDYVKMIEDLCKDLHIE